MPQIKSETIRKAMVRQRQTPKDLQEFRHSRPEQLVLFELTDLQEQDYSNTVELYDAIPKYYWGRTNVFSDLDNATVRRTFTDKHKQYTADITAAIITRKDRKTGEEKPHLVFPSQREELVEDALRKLATDGYHGQFLDDNAGVLFTLHELQKELQRMGHGYNKSQIKEAILVCQRTNITLTTDDGESLLDSGLFQWIGLKSEKDLEKHGKRSKGYVVFNPLVTQSIKNMKFRQVNYKACMSYRSNLARWLHKRLSYLYIQASSENSYTISMMRIFQESGWPVKQKTHHNRRIIETALNEAVEKKLLRAWEAGDPIKEGRRIVDIKYTLYPHACFIKEMKRANKIFSDLRLEGVQKNLLK